MNYDNRIEDNAERKRGGERLGLFTLFCLFIGFVVLHYFDHKEIAKKIKDLDERVKEQRSIQWNYNTDFFKVDGRFSEIEARLSDLEVKK